jgi:hypothetical protein
MDFAISARALVHSSHHARSRRLRSLWADVDMGPEGAVLSFRALGGHGLLMPIHWGLVVLALHHGQQPIERTCSQLKLWSPEPGTPSEVVRGQDIRSE